MTNTDEVETPVRHPEAKNSDVIRGELCIQKFYNPISVTGYLTPLQRKKLREKRKDFPVLLKETNGRENKRIAVKRKKRTETVSRDKHKDQIKRMKMKENIQQVQCSISKLVHKKTDNIQTKKFFKSSIDDRLNTASYTMPLVLKKNIFQNIDKSVKETLEHTRKLYLNKNKMRNSLPENLKREECTELKNNDVLHSEKDDLNESSSVLTETDTYLAEENEIPSAKPNAEKLLFEFNWPSDEELFKRREKARELVRKQNVLKDKNNIQTLIDVKNGNKNENGEGSQVKFYPIFQLAVKKQVHNIKTKRPLKNVAKKMRASINSRREQAFIDAGQKEIGPKICGVCNMIYTIGQEEDETLHSNYHNMHVSSLKFPGWKEENVVGEYSDGRVIMIRHSEKGFKMKKVEDVLQVANRDLGFSSSAVPDKPDLAFLLFISNNKVVAGCIVAEPISKAFQVLLVKSVFNPSDTEEKDGKVDNWCSSSEAVPAVCGVNRIWVAHNFRRRKVASRLVDCLRCHFIHGHVIGIREIAFTDPSPAGRQFAAAYTGTSNFLVYK